MVIVVSFAWYSSFSLSQGIFYLQTMFGLRTVDFLRSLGGGGTYAPLWSSETLYLLMENWLLLAACLLVSTSIVHRNAQRLHRRFPRVMEGVTLLTNTLLFTGVLAFMVA